MFNKTWFVALMGLVALAATSNAEVVNLTEANFESTIKSNDYTLVKFTQEWCGHCKTLKPMYELASKKMPDNAKLASVDCGADDAKALCEKYQVRGYPTIKGFSKDLSSVEYDDARSEDALVGHVLAATQPAVTIIKDSKELEQFKKGPQDLKLVINTAEDSDLAKTVEGISKTLRKATSIAIDTTKTDGKITLYRTFDEPEVVFEDEKDIKKITGSALTSFVSNNSLPIIGEIGPNNYKKYIDRNVPLVWIFIDYSSKEQVAALESLKPLAKELTSKFGFAKLDGKKWSQHAKSMGLDSSTPGIVIEERSAKKRYRYPATTINNDDFKAFLDGFQAKTLEPIFKSQPIPEQDSSKATVTVVGKNFDDVVVNNDKDVFVMHQAPWCGHCKSAKAPYEELAQSFKGDSNIVIATIDSTENDSNTPYEVTGFPTFYIYPKGAKSKPIRFNGTRDLESFREFVEKNRKTEPANTDEDEKMSHEEL